MNVQENVHVAKGLGGWLMALWYMLLVLSGCLISTLLVLIVGGSLAAQWNGGHSLVLMVATGLGLCLIPAIILNGFTTWLRHLWNPQARFFDTFFSVFLLGNVALMVSLTLWVPGKTSRALYQYGNWLFDRDIAHLLQISEQHPVLHTGRKLVRRMAYLLDPADGGQAQSSTQLSSDTAANRKPPSPIQSLGPTSGHTLPERASPAKTRVATSPSRVRQNEGVRGTRTAVLPAPVGGTEDVLQVRRHGNSLVVTLGLPGLRRDFLLDTGASFLSLSSATARRLRVTPSAHAPTLALHTANGVINARVGLLSSLQIGKYKLRHVAFVLCDACGEPQQDVVGLLGLNVLRRFLVTIDQASGTVRLRPQEGERFRNQSADLRPFLLWPNDQLRGHTTNILVRRIFQLNGVLQNKSSLNVAGLRFRIGYLRNKKVIGHYEFSVGELEANSQLRVSVRDKSAPQFESYRVELVDGRWDSP